MLLTITPGAYGFFTTYRERQYDIYSPEDLANVWRDTNDLFNAIGDPWGLEIRDGSGVLNYMWSIDQAEDVWEDLNDV